MKENFVKRQLLNVKTFNYDKYKSFRVFEDGILLFSKNKKSDEYVYIFDPGTKNKLSEIITGVGICQDQG